MPNQKTKETIVDLLLAQLEPLDEGDANYIVGHNMLGAFKWKKDLELTGRLLDDGTEVEFLGYIGDFKTICGRHTVSVKIYCYQDKQQVEEEDDLSSLNWHECRQSFEIEVL